MKIQLNQLSENLKNNIAPFYLISGDEVLLVEEACELIRKTLRDKEFTERQSWHVETGFNWQQLLEAGNSLSLFAENSLLELRLKSNKINEAGKKALQLYLDNPPENKVLLIITGKLDGPTQKTKWVKSIETKGVLAQAWPISLQQLPTWIQSRLKKFDMTADSSAIRIIIEHTEGNLLATNQEIEKLSLQFSGKKITADDVIACVCDNARYDMFALIDAAVSGDTKKTLRIMSVLEGEGSEPILTLWSITRELRTLIKMSQQLKTSRNIDDVLQQNFVWEKRKPLVRAALQRHTTKSLLQLLQEASNIDRIIKGVAKGNKWDALTKIALGIALK